MSMTPEELEELFDDYDETAEQYTSAIHGGFQNEADACSARMREERLKIYHTLSNAPAVTDTPSASVDGGDRRLLSSEEDSPASDEYTGQPCPNCTRRRIFLRTDGTFKCEKCECIFKEAQLASPASVPALRDKATGIPDNIVATVKRLRELGPIAGEYRPGVSSEDLLAIADHIASLEGQVKARAIVCSPDTCAVKAHNEQYIAELEAKLVVAEADTKRLDWLDTRKRSWLNTRGTENDKPTLPAPLTVTFPLGVNAWTDDEATEMTVRAAIDSAMPSLPTSGDTSGQ